MTARTLYLGRHFFLRKIIHFRRSFPREFLSAEPCTYLSSEIFHPRRNMARAGVSGPTFFGVWGRERNTLLETTTGAAFRATLPSRWPWLRLDGGRGAARVKSPRRSSSRGQVRVAAHSERRHVANCQALPKKSERKSDFFFFFCLRRALDSGPSAIPNFLYARYPKRKPQGPPKTPRPGSSQTSISPPESRHEGGRCRFSRLNSIWGSELFLQWPTYLINSIISFAEISISCED